ncbi:hypothetical protein EKL30_17010 [Candidimonas sp. SYP-B2681]|uniref:hypothetical protein n=1 Tax=Candidimonas sp. SYP-B2681 TaxID=2497686 RepID=UPI000F86AED6|nr:hypothetical protein [Candidimonas sp. SYP-B2681]RTZ39957.1 hypothetical protein EKL30_17010 [Candidimonas sp. SYP-B2681]
MEKNDAWGTGWMIAALLLLAVIIVLTAFFPENSKFSWGTLWQAAAAIATAGAIIATLRISAQEVRWREAERKKEQEIARLYVMIINGEMTAVSSALKGAENSVPGIRAGRPETLASLNDAVSKVIQVAMSWSLGEISKASQASAADLARCVRTLKGIQNTISIVGANFKDGNPIAVYKQDVRASQYWFDRAYVRLTEIAYERPMDEITSAKKPI